ncbi:MAG TPA: tetratricopeptide repeat protein [Caulobacteraceae bacterium]|jgi:Flp pilus assembly protein TadD|nr:tetratricopeptide repeat protein [Caulobacteraceae bacterium]
MCPKPARLATALTLVLALAGLSSPAFALFGSKPKAADTAKSDDAKTAAAATEAAKPHRASPEERGAADRLEPIARAAFWTREAQIDPGDAEAGIKLAKALRAMGQYEQAAQAADVVLVTQPKNLEALLEDGRAKIGAGQGFYAIETLQRAKAAAPKDWRPLSLLGVALEQSERPDEAKQAYDQALVLSPENPAVLSNLALYFAGRGDRVQAEALLRRAVARPGAGAQERQNLALVLGLQGKVAEAEKLIRQDLPPEVANANLAYLRNGSALPVGAVSPSAANAAPSRNWNALEGAQIKK